MNSIKKKVVQGSIWQAFGRFSELFIQFVVTITIARVLSPEDYGIMGLLAVFIAIGQLIVDSGFSQALIRKKDVSQIDYSSVFYFNITLGLVIYLILYILAPYIANFYKIDLLSYVGRWMFLAVIINSIGIIQNTILQKKMEFQKYAIISIVAAIFSGFVGIWMAYSGYGIMSLVGQTLSNYLMKNVLLILFVQWIPNMTFSWESISSILPFGLNLLGSGLILVIFNNIQTLIIGKFYSAKEVGHFNQAKKFEEVSANTITQVMVQVSYPALVLIRDDKEKLKQAYSNIVQIATFIVVPLMLCLMCISKSLFCVLLTDKWLPASSIFKILCLYGITFPFRQISYNIYKVMGDGKTLFRISLLGNIIITVFLLLTVKFSLTVLLYGQVIASVIVVAMNMYISGKYIEYSMREQLRDIIPYYICASIAVCMVLFVSMITTMSHIGNILVSSGVIAVTYLILCNLLKTQAYKEIKSVIKNTIYKH